MKKSFQTIAVATGVLAAVASAQAAPLEINIYGASAQFAFLTAIADNLLKSTGTNGVGCASTSNATTIGTQFAITGNAGSGLCANGITLRIANKSSSDGIKAALKTAGVAQCTAGNDYRQFINPGDTTAPSSAVGGNDRCYPVTMAASDVDKATFGETSNGCQFGPVYAANVALGGQLSCGPAPGKSCATPSGTGACYYSNKTAAPIADPSNYLLDKNPMIVPFAFWANNSIQIHKCAAPDTNAGALCDATSGAGCATASNCAALPLDGLSRIQAANIFSGVVTDLTNLGSAYTSTSSSAGTSIRVCMRHAGSGTMATLHQAVMNGGKWAPADLTTDPDSSCNPSTGNWPGCLPTGSNLNGNPYTFFVDSSDDMMNCIASTDNAIGVVDADACNGGSTGLPGGANRSPYIDAASNVYGYNMCANVHPLAYNGYTATRTNVRDGLYDFWTKENLYLNINAYPSNTNQYKFQNAMYKSISPAFLTFTNAGDSANIWATVPEMKYSKLDKTYPSYTGASSLQTP